MTRLQELEHNGIHTYVVKGEERDHVGYAPSLTILTNTEEVMIYTTLGETVILSTAEFSGFFRRILKESAQTIARVST